MEDELNNWKTKGPLCAICKNDLAVYAAVPCGHRNWCKTCQCVGGTSQQAIALGTSVQVHSLDESSPLQQLPLNGSYGAVQTPFSCLRRMISEAEATHAEKCSCTKGQTALKWPRALGMPSN